MADADNFLRREILDFFLKKVIIEEDVPDKELHEKI